MTNNTSFTIVLRIPWRTLEWRFSSAKTYPGNTSGDEKDMPGETEKAKPDQATGVARTEQLLLAHISDIHFRKKAPNSDLYVPDDDLRRELINDIGGLKTTLGAFHGILITGDVAFSGDKDEYARARSWIRDLCKKTGCPEELVRTISGNHDVSRAAINKSALLKEVHKAIRAIATAQKFDGIDTSIQ